MKSSKDMTSKTTKKRTSRISRRNVAWIAGLTACAALAAWITLRPADPPRLTGAAGASAGAPATVVAPAPDAAAAEGRFHDTWLLKPPAGAKVAVYEFDDLECPGCAHALPLVHAAVARYGIPLVHHDFPLTEIHTWSFDAAVTARYLEDKVSPVLADAFRSDVFAHQSLIANKDDLARYTGQWFAAHSLVQPFVMDADGSCRNEVRADRAPGRSHRCAAARNSVHLRGDAAQLGVGG